MFSFQAPSFVFGSTLALTTFHAFLLLPPHNLLKFVFRQHLGDSCPARIPPDYIVGRALVVYNLSGFTSFLPLFFCPVVSAGPEFFLRSHFFTAPFFDPFRLKERPQSSRFEVCSRSALASFSRLCLLPRLCFFFQPAHRE